jgi:hypothetical protein
VNVIVVKLKNIYIQVEIERKEANKQFNATRSSEHWGDGEKYSKLETLTYLSEKLEAILNKLASKNNIKDFNESETIFKIEGSVFNISSDSIFHKQAKLVGVV